MAAQQGAFQSDAFQSGLLGPPPIYVWPFQSDAFQYAVGGGPTPVAAAAAQLLLTPMNPYALPWHVWVAVAALDLAETGYNLPLGAGEERLWQQWATELLQVPELVELGVQSPLPYGDDWRAWAATLHSLTA